MDFSSHPRQHGGHPAGKLCRRQALEHLPNLVISGSKMEKLSMLVHSLQEHMTIEKIFVFSRMSNSMIEESQVGTSLCLRQSLLLPIWFAISYYSAATSYVYIIVQDIDINKPIFHWKVSQPTGCTSLPNLLLTMSTGSKPQHHIEFIIPLLLRPQVLPVLPSKFLPTFISSSPLQLSLTSSNHF